ncbi:hypothetical protein GCM10010371_68200 [Streptomyces subrutilus]|uniref:Uncharacterized protein n=1 Tax=Streptomyces subrutilus TaxID=36818 RepID=A0A918RHE9_9ACTN|nr:hypothetical protein [Streptomyces subrutilus]GGZ99013.1 hypothetical protein GCM10010371_68200 [Streptomyces subrutilus]
MDVEAVAAELYGLVPSGFTEARDKYVARARKAGEKDLAGAIAALKKPTVAAWTAGLISRHRPQEARRFLELGAALRSAHRTLDAGVLRKLSHEQHVVIAELARTARALAAEAGQTVGEPTLHEVEGILHAVLADEEVAARWQAGRLAKAPDPVSGFAGLEPQPGAAPPRGKRPVKSTGSRAEHAPAAAPSRVTEPDADLAASRARRQRADAARAASDEARAGAERLTEVQAATQGLVERAEEAVAAEEDVRAAREQLEAARSDRTEARARLREVDRAAGNAQTRANAAARKAEKLTGADE